MPFPDPETLMGDTLRAFIDTAAFGETLTVYNDTFGITDPDEGTPGWIEDETGTEVSGRVEAREQTKEFENTTGETVRGEYHIYVADTVNVIDGRNSETETSSIIVDEQNNAYEVHFVEDQHNGLYRCIADLEVGQR